MLMCRKSTHIRSTADDYTEVDSDLVTPLISGT
jgi:hypothetical protein